MAQQQMTPEQAQALQEKIKNMSPEELKEFQKQQCIFCNIISGKVQSKKIYEDKKVLAILDINPANPGHVLLMPKEHYPIMPLVTKEELGQLAYVSKAISQAMLKALKAQGTTVFIANGVAAGQRAQHFMLHIIPRKENDKLPLDMPEKKISSEQIKAVREKLQRKINEIFKIKGEAVKAGEPEEKEPEKKIAKKKKKISKSKEPEEKPKEPGKKETIDLDSIADLFTK